MEKMVVKAAYCGVDIGRKSHFITILDAKQKVSRQYHVQNDLDGFLKLERDISRDTKMCLEPTGVYSINFFVYFRERKYDIRFMYRNFKVTHKSRQGQQKTYDQWEGC